MRKIFRFNSKREIAHSILIIMAVFFPLASCQAETDSVTIVYSGGIRGRASGCGCQSGIIGGLPRRVSVIQSKSVTGMFGLSVFPIGIDCGRILDLDPEGGRNATRCTVFGLAKMGLKVIGPTPRDLFYGVDFIQSLADSAGVVLVSANLIMGGTDSLLFEQWHVVNPANSNVKIAVTSLSTFLEGEQFAGSVRTWTVINPDSVLEHLEQFKPAADLYILLTDWGEQFIRENIDQFDWFDIILTSSRQVFTPSPFKLHNIEIIHPQTDGRAVEWFRLPDRKGISVDNISWFSLPLTRQTEEDEGMLKWLDQCQGKASSAR